ncbi:heat shock protein 27-like [Arctopsyche grandis]|uniref:heat shock protein 27-like n=1 Tax=Arctopsyche grandis TaxID=121162 RepID=UPI00406D79F4
MSFAPFEPPSETMYSDLIHTCPWFDWQMQAAQRPKTSAPGGPSRFQVCMDVQQFAPEEISVKTVDKFVVVEAKHDERQDEHGYIQRHFVRRYALPEGVEPNDVISSLSSDGVLTITVRDPIVLPDKYERIVPIQFSGTSHYAKDHRVDHESVRIHTPLKKHQPPKSEEKPVILAIKYI